MQSHTCLIDKSSIFSNLIFHKPALSSVFNHPMNDNFILQLSRPKARYNPSENPPSFTLKYADLNPLLLPLLLFLAEPQSSLFIIAIPFQEVHPTCVFSLPACSLLNFQRPQSSLFIIAVPFQKVHQTCLFSLPVCSHYGNQSDPIKCNYDHVISLSIHLTQCKIQGLYNDLKIPMLTENSSADNSTKQLKLFFNHLLKSHL